MSRSPRVPDPLDALAADIEAACRPDDHLAAHEVELHFAVDPSTGRVVAEVRDAGGEVLGRMTPRVALGLTDTPLSQRAFAG